jgi:hypothetical protein
VASNDYHFVTHWRVRGTVQEVRDILADAADLPRWWPAVYLGVHIIGEGDERGVGRVVDLYTKGWLPYTLRWQFRVTSVEGNGFALEAWGDFDGRGIWTFEPDGDYTTITYDWLVKAEKPLLRYFSFVMKPIFSANHRWAMAKGEESLRLELARRHARTPEQYALVPPPPPPTRVLATSFILVIALVLGALVFRRVRGGGSTL